MLSFKAALSADALISAPRPSLILPRRPSQAFATCFAMPSACTLLSSPVLPLAVLLFLFFSSYSFIHLVQKYSQDLDSIYFCEVSYCFPPLPFVFLTSFTQVLHACPVHDGGKAQLDKMSTTPPSGPQGTTFEIDVLFTVFNQTGTGELEIGIIPPQSQPFGDGTIDTGFAPGQYVFLDHLT
jgi:hypothetical protein